MVKKIVVVIGANYGDEGKGLASRYFALNNDDSQIVLFNGGPQRGHTVEKKNGFRHVFKHFGAGACDEIPTVFHRDFMVNPMIFAEEYNLLSIRGCTVEPEIYIHKRCRVITPFDMILNQLVEKSRGDKRHGSCGHGIWETAVRYNSGRWEFAWNFEDMCDATDAQLYAYLVHIRDNYMKPRLREYDIDLNDYSEYTSWIDSPGLITHYISDFNLMKEMAMYGYICTAVCDTLIFEGGQGLMLDQDNTDMWPHVTASYTGASQLVTFLRENPRAEIEICYVTRPYLTRHGAGPIENEIGRCPFQCKDETNVGNEYQGDLRYGVLDVDKLTDRILKDFSNLHTMVPNVKASVMITQCNDYQWSLKTRNHFYRMANKLRRNFKVYYANTRYAEDVEVSKDEKDST